MLPPALSSAGANYTFTKLVKSDHCSTRKARMSRTDEGSHGRAKKRHHCAEQVGEVFGRRGVETALYTVKSEIAERATNIRIGL